jgi:hypothetical protein
MVQLVSDEHRKFCENVDYLFQNCHTFKNLNHTTFHNNLKNFRIVKMENGTDSDWYLLQRKTGILSKLLRVFGYRWEWRVVCGCDRAAWGQFNNQADTASNAIAHITSTIPEILKAYMGNRQIYRFDRDGYPRGEITKELDIYKTLLNCNFTEEKDVFHCIFESAIYKEKEI